MQYCTIRSTTWTATLKARRDSNSSTLIILTSKLFQEIKHAARFEVLVTATLNCGFGVRVYWRLRHTRAPKLLGSSVGSSHLMWSRPLYCSIVRTFSMLHSLERVEFLVDDFLGCGIHDFRKALSRLQYFYDFCNHQETTKRNIQV